LNEDHTGVGARGIPFSTLKKYFVTLGESDARRRVSPWGFNWVIWGGGNIKDGNSVDYAAVALAESAPLMVDAGRRCETGSLSHKRPRMVKFTLEIAEAARLPTRQLSPGIKKP